MVGDAVTLQTFVGARRRAFEPGDFRAQFLAILLEFRLALAGNELSLQRLDTVF
jgi:hypothetical protein